MENTNFLRTKVKLDERSMKDVAELAGVSYPTLYRVIGANFKPIDDRLFGSLEKIARLYGYDVKVRLDFLPINGDENP